MTHYYAWKNNEKRATMYRKKCRVIGRSKRMNSILIEFETGQKEVTSRNAVRLLPEKI